MANKIQIKRGLFTSLPTSFLDGEFGWANDTHKLFIGSGSSKYEVLMKNEYNTNSFLYAATAANPENKTPAEVMGILSGRAVADFSLNNKKLVNIADPVDPQDAVNLRSMQAAQAGLSVKPEVRVATTTAGTLSSSFANGSVIDGVTLATGDRILIKNQSTASENGIYTVNASGSPTRASDFNEDADVAYGVFVFVQEGSVNADSGWVLSTDGTIVVGTTNLTFVQFTGLGQITAGDGLSKTGNTMKVTEDLVWDRDFSENHSILKADVAGQPTEMPIETNTVLGRISGVIEGIAIDTSVQFVAGGALLHTSSMIDGGTF